MKISLRSPHFEIEPPSYRSSEGEWFSHVRPLTAEGQKILQEHMDKRRSPPRNAQTN